MGVKKEDNLMALASLDVYNAYKEQSNECYKEPFYIEKGINDAKERILEIINSEQ